MKADRRIPFVVASAFSFVCAEIWLRRKGHNVALLMLNRSIEWALVAIAIEEGVVRLGPSQLQFTNYPDREVGVNSLLSILAKDGHLSANEIRDKVFKAINTTRNQLALTHGLGGIKHVDLANLMEQARCLIRDLDPKLGWWATVRKLRPNIVISRADIVRLLGIDALFRQFNVT